MPQEHYTNRPFKILSRARPRRIAFLIDPADCPPELLDAIFESNYTIWGGRYNPIIPVVSGAISASYWALLKFVDCDIIYSYCDISGDLIRQLDRDLCPLCIIRHRKSLPEEGRPNYSPSTYHEQISSAEIIPLIIQKAGRGFLKPRLITSAVDRNWPEYRLIHRNFGIFDERMAIKPYPEDQERIIINSDWTQDRFFEEVAHEVNPVVFPYLASEAFTEFPEPDVDSSSDYYLIIGDQVQDWIFFWNHIFGLGDYRRSRWSALCLPSESFHRESFLVALRKYLTNFAYRNGSSPSTIELTSSSVPTERLEEIKVKLFQRIDAFPKIGRILANDFSPISVKNRSYPEFYYPGAYLFDRKWTTCQQATSRKSILAMPDSPISLERGAWIMDLRIEFIPTHPFFVNEELWWQLPRQREFANLFLRHSRSIARVSVDQSISLEINTKDVFELTIPSARSVIQTALGVTPRYIWSDGFRLERKDPIFCRLDLSDKGEYINGIINLFGGLQNAGMFFENSFWHSIIEILSQRNPASEKEKEISIKNRLKKRADILKAYSEAPEKTIDFLSYEVLKLARSQHMIDVDISFSEIEKRFQDQREAYIEKNPMYRKDSTEEAIKSDRAEAADCLRSSLQYYTDIGIFRQGARLWCNTCGSKYWKVVDEIKQENSCPGCGGIVELSVQAQWRFRLNTLLKNAVAFHGCVPVILCLHSLRSQWPKYAFIWTSGLDLFSTPKDIGPAAEIDLACIIDGKLAIGEVKTNSKEFSTKELEKLADLVKKLDARIVVLGCFQDQRSQMRLKESELKRILNDSDCEIWTYIPSNHVFEPTPIS